MGWVDVSLQYFMTITERIVLPAFPTPPPPERDPTEPAANARYRAVGWSVCVRVAVGEGVEESCWLSVRLLLTPTLYARASVCDIW